MSTLKKRIFKLALLDTLLVSIGVFLYNTPVEVSKTQYYLVIVAVSGIFVYGAVVISKILTKGE